MHGYLHLKNVVKTEDEKNSLRHWMEPHIQALVQPVSHMPLPQQSVTYDQFYSPFYAIDCWVG